MSIASRLKATSADVEAPKRTSIAKKDPAPQRQSGPLTALKQKAHTALFGRLGARLYDPNLSFEELRRIVQSELEDLLDAEMARLSSSERTDLVAEITGDLLGLGPIESFLADPEITEVMVNSDDSIFVEREGRLFLTDVCFVSKDHLLQVIQRIVTTVGRRIDQASPMVDARLPDGSRVNAVIPPLSIDGPMLTVRKFSTAKFGIDDLVNVGALSPAAANLLTKAVVSRKTILVSGGTGSGKTTMLNALSSHIPDDERIITIEDAAELQLQQRHTIRLESRPPNVEDVGEVTIRDLVRNSLRMRPDRIIVGEVRGGEALDMLQAMNTGHDGSLSTIHSNSPRDALARIETMVLSAGIDFPLRAIREQVTSALDLVVQVDRLPDGRRAVSSITEVERMEGDVTTLTALYELVDTPGGLSLEPTGSRASFHKQIGLDDGIGDGDQVKAEKATFW